MSYILEINRLSKCFYKNNIKIKAVDNVSFKIAKGEALGIAGESGSGKSTIAKLITGLVDCDSGSIQINGTNVASLKEKSVYRIYNDVQMVFQNPIQSFNPRKRLGEGVVAGMLNNGYKKKEAYKKASELFELCGLSVEYLKRFPHEVSGGECQRAAIARAISVNPKLLICDEATSALDVTVQKQIMNLLKKLKQEYEMSFMFISHDIALISEFCDTILVIKEGRTVEYGDLKSVILTPASEYTKRLLDNVF